MSLRLLHMADLHLDMSFAADGLPPSYGTWRRGDLRAALGRILTLARGRHVDVVTIAGDLIHQPLAVPDTASFLAQQFAQVDPIRIVIAPGPSDPYTSDSLYALSHWPRNVTIFSQGHLERVELTPDISLWGAAYPRSRGTKLLEMVGAAGRGTNLLLLHDLAAAQEVAAEGHVALDAEAVRQAGFTLALLGGEHRRRVSPAHAPVCVYPGSPEPLGWAEADGPHGVVLVTLDAGRATLEPIETGRWRYSTLRVDLTTDASPEDVRNAIAQALVSRGLDDERSVVRVVLTGTPDIPLDLKQAQDAAASAHLLPEVDLTLPYNLAQLAEEPTVRGRLVRRIQQRLAEVASELERLTLQNALRLALRALDGKEVRPYEVH